MIIGIGTDLVEISRIADSMEKFGNKFAERILADTELVEFHNKVNVANFVAKRFAVKEAASKALGSGIGANARWHDIVVDHADNGAPILKLEGKAGELARRLGVKSMHVSISDERDYALAFVVLSGSP